MAIDLRKWSLMICLSLLVLQVPGVTPGLAQTSTPSYQVFAFNDLGMHCYDSDFSVAAVLPPYNVVRAQVLLKGQHPQFLDPAQVKLSYRAVADPTGSINRTSVNKTNFWTYVQDLFGVTLAVDVGVKGYRMPGSANRAQLMAEYDPQMRWFGAEGIPITAFDDAGVRNTLPLMQVRAQDKATGTLLSSLKTVVPASDEMNCSNCHVTGGIAANQATVSRHGLTRPWSANPDLGLQTKENVLILHDGINRTSLTANQPVLCASCHYSAALDLAGQGPQGAQAGKPQLSHAIHTRHGKTIDNALPDAAHPAIIAANNTNACYQCHPGQVTKCLRGAMATANISCQGCHGGMLAVGGFYNLRTTGQPRQPWKDLPKCQSCHTGDAVSHAGKALVLRQAYVTSDPAATPRNAANKRFAEENNTLYRFSLGHNGVACQSCHGSPHAEWPTRNGTNDNIAARQIQGHTGPIIECASCHGNNLPRTINGPHGLHNINDPNWYDGGHESFAENNRDNCRACHGQRGEGTALSKVAAARVLQSEGQHSLAKGTPVSCNLCHENPL
ncbi:MAG: cytochrome C [Deltaproteobacteria bacterium]|nr:MAG: cytochrome C [Deltaproteobacteria bacterium]